MSQKSCHTDERMLSGHRSNRVPRAHSTPHTSCAPSTRPEDGPEVAGRKER